MRYTNRRSVQFSDVISSFLSMPVRAGGRQVGEVGTGLGPRGLGDRRSGQQKLNVGIFCMTHFFE